MVERIRMSSNLPPPIVKIKYTLGKNETFKKKKDFENNKPEKGIKKNKKARNHFYKNNDTNHQSYKKFPSWILEQSQNTPLDYEVFRVTDESKNFSLLPYQVSQIDKIISEKLENLKNVNYFVDATSHIGVDSAYFAYKLNRPDTSIVCIEIEPNTYKILKENMLKIDQIIKTEFKGKIESKNMDCVDFIENLQGTVPDLIYFDPPWGGKSYIEKETISLTLGKYSLGKLLNLTLKKGVKNLVVKLPKNINLCELEQETKDPKTTINWEMFNIMKKQEVSYKLLLISQVLTSNEN